MDFLKQNKSDEMICSINSKKCRYRKKVSKLREPNGNEIYLKDLEKTTIDLIRQSSMRQKFDSILTNFEEEDDFNSYTLQSSQMSQIKTTYDDHLDKILTEKPVRKLIRPPEN